MLHDQTSAELTKVLGELENVNVTLVPYRLRHRGGLTPVPSSGTQAARPIVRPPALAMTAQPRRRTSLDGEGVGWAVGAFVASLLIGLLIEPFRATIGLENVVICYLLVVVAAAAIGGRAAGIVAAVSAALAYDFFLTTPYHTLVIDSLAQVITVALLVATGIVVSIGGRVRRRSAAAAEAHADAIRLLHRVTETAAAGGAVDRVAAEGLQRLLGARRVSILRRSPAGFTVTVDIGETRLRRSIWRR